MSFKDIFKKSFPIPHYSAVKFGKYTNSDEKFKGANKHSWTIENKSKSCAFSVYDKSYELEKRHDIKIDEHILRLELRFGRSKITKLTKAKDWESQLIELGSQVENQQHNFSISVSALRFFPDIFGPGFRRRTGLLFRIPAGVVCTGLLSRHQYYIINVHVGR